MGLIRTEHRQKKLDNPDPSKGAQGCGANAINKSNGSTWAKKNDYNGGNHPQIEDPGDYESQDYDYEDLKENIANAKSDICSDCECKRYEVTWEVDEDNQKPMGKQMGFMKRMKGDHKKGSKKGECPKKQ